MRSTRTCPCPCNRHLPLDYSLLIHYHQTLNPERRNPLFTSLIIFVNSLSVICTSMTSDVNNWTKLTSLIISSLSTNFVNYLRICFFFKSVSVFGLSLLMFFLSSTLLTLFGLSFNEANKLDVLCAFDNWRCRIL